MTEEGLTQRINSLQHEIILFEKYGAAEGSKAIANTKSAIIQAFRELQEENERLKRPNKIDFTEAKQRKKRGTSVRELAEETAASANDYDALLVVGVSFSGGLDIGFSGDNEAELIGMAEVAKSVLVEGIRESE